jgi:hypothetical protein
MYRSESVLFAPYDSLIGKLLIGYLDTRSNNSDSDDDETLHSALPSSYTIHTSSSAPPLNDSWTMPAPPTRGGKS